MSSGGSGGSGVRAVVLLSGGQDSTTCLFTAVQRYGGGEKVVAVGFDYGQRHRVELEAARQIARLAGVEYRVIRVGLDQIGGSALVDREEDGGAGVCDVRELDGLPATFTPMRNLVFLALAGSLAIRLGAREVWTGVCQTDYSGYPDCREGFVKATQEAMRQAMGVTRVSIVTPLMDLTKADTVRIMAGLGATAWHALGLSVTCYSGKEGGGCGTCPACVLRAKGFSEAGMLDPAIVGIDEGA